MKFFQRTRKKISQARKFKRILVTGGAGFIGSHLVRLLVNKGYEVTVLDSLTYAGSLDNIKDINHKAFLLVDITDLDALRNVLCNSTNFDGCDDGYDAFIHLAAESHVDNSIKDPLSFMKTNVNGTVNMLEIAVEQHKRNSNFVFYHVSTDEVFGSLELNSRKKFCETTPYDPRSPYSASKASSDHFVRAYNHTYGLPVLISNCSNNYGTHQYMEKLIPVIIDSLSNEKDIPVYGSGLNKRDWLHVEDHADAIHEILINGYIGETYCIGGNNVMSNIDLVHSICDIYDDINEDLHFGNNSRKLIKFVEDRKGHDMQYAIDNSKIKNELGWKPKINFEDGLRDTIDWYTKQKTK